MLEGMGVPRWRGAKGKKWNNCNRIINKIYFQKNRDVIHKQKIKLHGKGELKLQVKLQLLISSP